VSAREIYGDIINLPHHKSKKHPPMLMIDRAAQFAPFAALTGHADAIKEEGRYTSEFIQLTDEQKNELDEKLKFIIENDLTATITYFIPDDKKSGGEYVTQEGKIKKIKFDQREILLSNGGSIPFDMITDIN
jgi:hypothetical protein